ncbi:MAG: sulfatase-like hydrolase/transferase, partial [Balneolaceae bacterium]|nr:sulfatase-like hydrolase/transferase [Balneolaceae bacterium]
YNGKGIFPTVPESPYTEDGEEVEWPEGRYSTNLYTDKLISYIDRYVADDRPFFAYAAYTSPHWPLQVDPKYWKKYEEQYRDGYEALRLRRFENQKKLGLIPEEAELPPLHPNVKPWDSLSEEQQKREVREMALYAGMVENLDHNIGRLLRFLKDKGEYDNTLIVFISDNGAAAEDFYNHEYFGPFLREHYSDDYEEMGESDSFISYGPEWAEAGASPFRYFKGYTTEGGINTPMVIAGPGVTESGMVSHAFTTLMDLAPTFYELAGITYPDRFNGRKVYPLRGRSLMSLLSGETERVHPEDYVFALEHRGYVQVRRGDWKLVNIDHPFSEQNFRLYNLARDLAEQVDLKEAHPRIYRELLEEWRRYRDEVKVRIPPPSRGTGLQHESNQIDDDQP